MEQATLKELTQSRGEPAVSILCPLEARRPGNRHDPRVLAGLRDQAVEGVEAVLRGSAASSLIAQIDDAIATVDLAHPSPAVAVLIAPGFSRVVPLDTAVEPHVVVGKTFATHDLVASLARHHRGRVLVLAQAKTRCIDLSGNEAVEHLDDAFPVEVEPPTEADTPHRDFPLGEHEHAEAAKFVFRAVDHALTAVQRREALPLVLMGTERDIAFFERVTNWRASVVGRVFGNYERAGMTDIARSAGTVLAEHAEAQQQAMCDDIREGLGTRAVAGISDTWRAARDGLGHQLVVEDGFRFWARVVDGALEAAPEGETTVFDAVDDTVDAVIRHDGEVVPVRAGRLSDLARIALVVRA